jgi:hypothetical protein
MVTSVHGKQRSGAAQLSADEMLASPQPPTRSKAAGADSGAQVLDLRDRPV